MAIRYSEFMMRRLHSLTGIVPMGAFLFNHFLFNAFSLQGEAKYDEHVELLRTLPFLLAIETFLIFGPFAYHIAYGCYIMYTGQVTVRENNHARNWVYFLLRLSAIPTLLFIVYHLYTTRFGHITGSIDHSDPKFYRYMTDHLSNPLYFGAYLIGILSVCFHFAAGLSTFCMSWGITVSATSQKYVGYACVGVGVTLATLAIGALLGFRPEGLEDHVPAAAEAAGHAVESSMRLLREMRSLLA